MERRTRLKTAPSVKILAAVLIASPFVATRLEAIIQALAWQEVVQALPISSIIMYGWACLSGALLLAVRRPFSLINLYAFSLVAAGYGWYLFLMDGQWYSLGPVILNSLLLAFVVLRFYRGPLKHPFLANHWRGFRRTFRTSTEINVIINDRKLVTDDISASGLRVHWPDCESDVGDEVEISFLLHSKPVILAGGITRIDSNTVSIAFRHQPTA